MSKKEVSVRGTMPPKAIITVLEDLLESFKKGQVVIQNGSEFVTLKPSEQISMELEAGQKKEKEKLTLELSWQRPVEMAPEQDKAFKISAVEPPLPAPEAPVEAAPAVVSEFTSPMVLDETEEKKGKKKY